MGELFKYALWTPIRIGKSWFGVIAFGLLLFVIYNVVTLCFALWSNWYFTGTEPISEIGSFLAPVLQFYPSRIFFELYANLLIVLIVLSVFLHSNVKYVLPSDIYRAFRVRLKSILALVLFYSLLEMGFSIILDRLNYDWMIQLYDHLIWILIMILFAIIVFNVFAHERDLKKSSIEGLKFFNEGNLSYIFVLCVLFYAAIYFPNLLQREVNDLLLNFYSGLYENYLNSYECINFIIMTISYLLGALLMIVDLIVLSIFAGAVTKISAPDPRNQ